MGPINWFAYPALQWAAAQVKVAAQSVQTDVVGLHETAEQRSWCGLIEAFKGGHHQDVDLDPKAWQVSNPQFDVAGPRSGINVEAV